MISLKRIYFQIFQFSYFISNKCWDGLFYLRAIGQARNPNHKALVGQNIKLQIYDSPCQMLLWSTNYRSLMIAQNNIIYYQLIAAYSVMSLSVPYFWAETYFVRFLFVGIFCYRSLTACSAWKQPRCSVILIDQLPISVGPLPPFFFPFLNLMSSSCYSNHGYC